MDVIADNANKRWFFGQPVQSKLRRCDAFYCKQTASTHQYTIGSGGKVSPQRGEVLTMLIGYARVSTDDQNLNLQYDALRAAGCSTIYEDRKSGAGTERPGLKALLAAACAGDTVVVWRLDRLGRSLKDLIRMVERLEARGVGMRSLQEAIDTTSSGGRLVFHIFGALAEFERTLIAERTKAGLAAARARGRVGGRPRRLDADGRRQAVRLYDDKTQSVAAICRRLGICRQTLYNYVAEAHQSAGR
jgi:DNA invertase Pin-like site-specific DNA recombinase